MSPRGDRRCTVSAPWRASQDDEVPLLQIPNEVIGHELRHEVITVPEPAAAIALKSHRDRQPKFIRISGTEVVGLAGHTRE